MKGKDIIHGSQSPCHGYRTSFVIRCWEVINDILHLLQSGISPSQAGVIHLQTFSIGRQHDDSITVVFCHFLYLIG